MLFIVFRIRNLNKSIINYIVLTLADVGAAVKMEHFQAALDPRKQELLEARFLGARVSQTNAHNFN